MSNVLIFIAFFVSAEIMGVLLGRTVFAKKSEVLGELRMVTDKTDGESYVAIAAPRSALETLQDGDFVTLQVKEVRQ